MIDQKVIARYAFALALVALLWPTVSFVRSHFGLGNMGPWAQLGHAWREKPGR